MAGGVNKEEMKQCLKDANIYEDHLSDDLISQYYKAIKNSETSLIEESEVGEGAKSLNDSANELLEAINNSESIAPSKKRRFLAKSAEYDEESLDGFSPDSLEQTKPKPIEDEANNNNYNHGTDSKVKRIQGSSHLPDIDKITFNDMPKSNNKNILKIVTHEPQFINVQNSRQFLDGDQQMRLKLLTDYHFAVAQRKEDFARTLSNMAPKLKPITAVNHNLLVNPVLSALKEDKALNATETYVSRSGRMTKRKVYTDEYEEVATEESSVPPKKSRSDDNWTSKNTVRRLSSKKGESSEALSSGSVEDTSSTKQYVKPKRGESPDSSQDIVADELVTPKQSPEAPKPRTYQNRTPSNQEIISRSTLFKDLDTPRKGRSAAILNAAKEKDESRKREEQEMTRFADSLDSQIVDDDDDDDDGIYNDSEHILVDGDIEVIEKRRISPVLPIRRRSICPKKGSNPKESLNITNKKLNSLQTSSPLVNGAIGQSPLPKSGSGGTRPINMVRLASGWTAIIVICFAVCQCKGNAVQSLDGTWVGRETDFWYEFPTTVPGGVYSDLMDLQIIDDVFFGFNDNLTTWVGTINWTYALNFTVEPSLLEHENVNLVFEGVDTFADIVLNNVTIGSTTNMFVRYVFDVKELLKAEGNNTIVLNFANAPEVGLKRNVEQLKKYRIPWECPPDAYRGVCHINMIRKMQASFAWDWGVALPSMGIWKPVYIEAFDETVIRHLVTRVDKSEDESKYLINIDTYFAPNQRGSIVGTLAAKIYLDESEEVLEEFEVHEQASDSGEIVSSVTLAIDAALVQLWWPNGYGEQPLYEVEVTFGNGAVSSIVSKKVKIGFRFVELVEDSIGDDGQTFYFKVNGEPIFVKGSNEIPINILPELGQDRQTIRYLLQSAKEVNMNMLRVWGGGVYESDYFYEIADQLGIMIWQDFMFACSLYPATEDFLTDVIAEVDHNIKRLYHHPSIVVYSGNNENEGVLSDNWYSTADNYDQYKADYVALYIETVRTQFDRISGGQGLFISSSPSNAKLTESEGWVGQSPSNQFWGDVHFYNYILDSWDSNSYPIPRFCSEYGYQSFPLEDSWLTATNDSSDLEITSVFMDWRQHHTLGNEEITLLISENLQLPDIDSEQFSSAFFYLSQIYSAQAIRVETEHYRRYRSYLTEAGKGYTMGALYWQLNDVWVAPTWSSIDYTGRWKMLHYFAKSFFANIIVTGHKNLEGQIQLYTVNDQLSPVDDVSVLVQIFNYDSPEFQPVHEYRLATTLTAGASQLIETIETEDVLRQAGCERTTCFFYFVAQKNASLTYSTAISPENYVFPAKLKESALSSPNVEITSVSRASSKTFDITVRSDNIALFVWLDSHAIKGRFSDNGFLQVEPTRTVSFQSDDETTVEDLQAALTVTHLKHSRWA